MTAISVVPPPMLITMLPVGVSTGSPTPIAAAIGSATMYTFRARRLRRVTHRALLDLGDAARHADDDFGTDAEEMAVDDRFQKEAQHFFGDVEVGDHAVLQRPHSEHAVRGAAQHALRFETDAFDFAGGFFD